MTSDEDRGGTRYILYAFTEIYLNGTWRFTELIINKKTRPSGAFFMVFRKEVFNERAFQLPLSSLPQALPLRVQQRR